MNRDAYLSDPHVRDFVYWAAPLVSGGTTAPASLGEPEAGFVELRNALRRVPPVRLAVPLLASGRRRPALRALVR